MSGEIDIVEIQSCIVCAKLFTVRAVYTPEGRLVNCALTYTGAHVVPNEHQPVIVCDTHPTKEIEMAYNRWKTKNNGRAGNEPVDEWKGTS